MFLIGTIRRKFGRILDISKNLEVNNKPFSFLDRLESKESKIKYSWTTASAISRPLKSITKEIKVSDKLFKEVMYNNGDPILREGIVNFFRRQGISSDDKNVIIGNGVFDILNVVYDILIGESDKEVLMPTPIFGYYYVQLDQKGIKCNFLKTTEENNWRIDPLLLDQMLKQNDKIKILLLNYPNNPLGTIMTKEYAESIKEVISHHRDLYVISDEILSDIILNHKEQNVSIGSIIKDDRIITLNGVSKSRALAGLRVSFANAPEYIVKSHEKKFVSGYPTTNQLVAANAINDNKKNKEYLEENIDKYHSNIAFVCKQITLINNNLNKHFKTKDQIYIKPFIKDPDAGNVYLINFSGLKGKELLDKSKLKTGLDVAEFIKKFANIAVVPGECSWIDPNRMTIRINLSNSKKEFKDGFNMIGKAFIEQLKPLSDKPNSTSIKGIEIQRVADPDGIPDRSINM